MTGNPGRGGKERRDSRNGHPLMVIETNTKGAGKPFRIFVSEKDQRRRLDQVLAEADLDLSRSHAKQLVQNGLILLNGKPAKASTRLNRGDTLSGVIPQPQPLSVEPEPLPLRVLFEDASIIVVDKPAGMVVHPAAGNPAGTLVNALLYHCRDLGGIGGVLRPGIVHRLDKDTSGVMVVAKNDEAHINLTKQFKGRSVEKVYLAIARGRFAQREGIIDAEIGRHPSERKRMSTRTRKGKEAVTRWRVLEQFDAFDYLEIVPHTGRTHQIRVHLASVGHPLLGDQTYGRRRKDGSVDDPKARNGVKRLRRQALHAHRLTFHHPKSGERVQFLSPIPPDMEEVLDLLRSFKKPPSPPTGSPGLDRA